MVLFAVASASNMLRFISVYEGDAYTVGPWYTSFAGGGVFTINGIGFNEDPGLNQVIFTTSDLGTSEITLYGPALSGKSPIQFWPCLEDELQF